MCGRIVRDVQVHRVVCRSRRCCNLGCKSYVCGCIVRDVQVQRVVNLGCTCYVCGCKVRSFKALGEETMKVTSTSFRLNAGVEVAKRDERRCPQEYTIGEAIDRKTRSAK